MTEELALVEAALFQLRSAAASVDEMFAAQMQLVITVLSNAVDGARQAASPAAVNDIEFALNDVVGIVDQLSEADAERIVPIITVLQDDVGRLKEATALPAGVVAAVRAFQEKLRARRAAIERQTYREGGGGDALPHPPEELHADAGAIRPLLVAAGFDMPTLDELIADPHALRLHSINEILNELDVIIGA